MNCSSLLGYIYIYRPKWTEITKIPKSKFQNWSPSFGLGATYHDRGPSLDFDNLETAQWHDAMKLHLPPWSWPRRAPQCSGITLVHWSLKILRYSLGSMHQYCGGSLQNDNCHFGWLRDALKCEVAHFITKMALPLHPSVGFGRIWYRWKVYSMIYMEQSRNQRNTTWYKH